MHTVGGSWSYVTEERSSPQNMNLYYGIVYIEDIKIFAFAVLTDLQNVKYIAYQNAAATHATPYPCM